MPEKKKKASFSYAQLTPGSLIIDCSCGGDGPSGGNWLVISIVHVKPSLSEPDRYKMTMLYCGGEVLLGVSGRRLRVHDWWPGATFRARGVIRPPSIPRQS